VHSRSRWLIAGGASVALLAGAVITICLTLAPTPAEPANVSAPVVSPTETSVVEEPADVEVVPTLVLADRILIPTGDLDVELREVGIVNGAMNLSDDLTVAFIAKEDNLPTVVALHSSTLRDVDGSIAIGNRLFDRDTQQPLLGTGRTLYVDGVKFITQSWEIMDKDELAAASAFSGADTLLLISCAQKADGTPSTDNLVITAVPA